MKKIRGKLTYANVVATLCLFLILSGGAAFAATRLAKNSVGTKQIRNGSITAAKIRNHTITGAKLKLATLGAVPKAQSADSAGNAALLAGETPSAFQKQVRWAVVNANGAIVAQSGGISNDAHDPAGCTPGCDFLDFGASQAGKAVLVSARRTTSENFHLEVASVCGTASIDASECFTGTGLPVNDPNHVIVLSALPGGASKDGGYYIAIVG